MKNENIKNTAEISSNEYGVEAAGAVVIEKVLNTEYSEEFDTLRKNRVVVSYYKYGSVKENYGGGLLEALPALQKCIDKYLATGNTEYLLDAGNYAMFEFMYPTHKKAHFRATDSRESAGVVGMSANEIRAFDRE